MPAAEQKAIGPSGTAGPHVRSEMPLSRPSGHCVPRAPAAHTVSRSPCKVTAEGSTELPAGLRQRRGCCSTNRADQCGTPSPAFACRTFPVRGATPRPNPELAFRLCADHAPNNNAARMGGDMEVAGTTEPGEQTNECQAPSVHILVRLSRAIAKACAGNSA